MADAASIDDTAVLLKALLAIAVDLRERTIAGEANVRRTELVLDSVGIAPTDIAKLLGKKPGTVRKALSRAKKSGGLESDE